MAHSRFRLIAATGDGGDAGVLLQRIRLRRDADVQRRAGPDEGRQRHGATGDVGHTFVDEATPYVRQYYSEDAWGSVIHLSSNDDHHHELHAGYDEIDGTTGVHARQQHQVLARGGRRASIVTVVDLGIEWRADDPDVHPQRR